MPASQTILPLKEQSPKWYFIVKGQLISVRADNRVQAFNRARNHLLSGKALGLT